MSTKSSTPQVSVPEYNKPTPSNFNTPWGNATYSNNSWNYSMSPDEQATMNQASQIRSDLLKSLGVSAGGGQDEYTKAYMNNLLSLTQPKTENALIGRGLGGSSVYQNALTDLITKAGNEAILSGSQNRLNSLSALQNILQPQQNFGQNLLNMSSGDYNTQQQLAQQLYSQTLPLKTTYNAGTDYSGLGSLAGMGAGLVASALLPGSQVAWLPLLAAQAGKSAGSIF